MFKKVYIVTTIIILMLSTTPVSTEVVATKSEESIPKITVETVEFETPKSSVEPLGVSEEEIELLALITMAESGGEPAEGQRLVIDTILNRVDSEHFPDTITEVIYQPNQFSPMSNGAIERCYVRDDIYQLVLEELESRTNDVVLYFRANHYHNFGTPVTQIGGHYFSTY